MGVLLKLLWEAVEGWLPWPQGSIAVPPWLFYPLFGLWIMVKVRQGFLEFREERCWAVAHGLERQQLWAGVASLIIIGGFGWWFIQS